ncbi:ABC-type sugar transport system periplasmic component [Acidipropionibacterium acidipropionici ATCC 4875]|uniref:ABC-type sugar transport system periplasmic component n=1 Tax=Acidipropionibacterium acidipropionici (strain ATCC 4875 / DSM 20272 / JCM 6432 / NBRC 12425 / NCIMB 8070 / 4) TaxID=1171373 RepID=K7RQW9_ACIA4|nr:ABC transporter substrate-binding protein [Acidipropionibacterium acidipropionici]AFV90394.1 ABC-type sugar transport system periplasmic component [Acidipropionibacterium acidipropionici ATCC 4875]
MIVNRRTLLGGLLAAGVVAPLAACGGKSSASAGGGDSKAAKDITAGFVAVGPEGGFRTANENDIRDAFKKAGITLKYSPTSNGDQQPQLTAFSSFVDAEVDVILLSATEDTGWDKVLKEAKDAEIPVITLDRDIKTSDASLVACHIGPDNVWCGKAAADYVIKNRASGGNAIVLEGPAGLSVVNDRNEGWNSQIKSWKGKVLEHQSAQWSTEQGKTVTQGLLDKYHNKIDVIFAQNDEMGLGAAQAVVSKGLTTGPKGVEIITIDGTKPALQACIDGKLSYVIEYNPIFGAQAVDAAKKLVNGQKVEKDIVIANKTFTAEEAKKVIASRPY